DLGGEQDQDHLNCANQASAIGAPSLLEAPSVRSLVFRTSVNNCRWFMVAVAVMGAVSPIPLRLSNSLKTLYFKFSPSSLVSTPFLIDSSTLPASDKLLVAAANFL